MFRYLFIIVVLSFFISPRAIALQHQISLEYNEKNRIGGIGDDYIFDYPNSVVSDSAGNIYVSERRQSIIKKFSKDGKLEVIIGGRGQGPGEFLEISSLAINNDNNEIIVIDRMSQRVNFFSLEGEYLHSKNIFNPSHRENIIVSPWMAKANSTFLFMLYRVPQMPGAELNEDDNLVHVYNLDKMRWANSFAPSSLIGDLDNDFINNLVGGPTTGFLELIDSNSILFMPFINKGKFYIYKQVGSIWSESLVLKADSFEGDAYMEINAENPPDYARVIGTQSGRITGLIYKETIGGHSYNNKYILVYTYTRDDNFNGEVGVNIFSYETGRYIGYESIKVSSLQDDIGQYQISPVRNIHYNNGMIYFVDRSNDDWQVVSASIDIK